MSSRKGQINSWFVAILAIACGAGLGIASSVVRLRSQPIDRAHLEPVDYTSTVLAAEEEPVEGEIEKYPKAEVFPSDSYNFGTMARDSKQQYTFTIRNTGKAPLTVEYVDSTCKCTVGALDKNKVMPFESCNVTLEWTAESYELDFRQSARLRTNDHNNETISLTVHGKVQQVIRPVPPNLVLTDISQHQPVEARVNIYAYRDELLEIIDPMFLNKEQDFFDLEVKPLSEEQVKEEPNAKSGVELIFTTKANIKVGPVQQTLRMSTNLPDVQLIEIPIRGLVGSDISIVPGGYRFHKTLQRLFLEPIDGEEGKEVQIFLLVKGPYAESIELEATKVDPELMEVKFGEPRKLRTSRMYPLTLTIPPGTRPINRKGTDQGDLAEFTIKTSHPDVPEMRIEVELYVH